MKRLSIIHTFVALACVILLPNIGRAQLVEAHSRVNTEGYDYWLYTPKSTSEAKPLIIYLHGQSCCGTNLNKVRRYGTIDAVERGYMLDAYVIAPQNRKGRWDPAKVWDIVTSIEQNCAVDTNRIYVLGMSLGGFGTINTAAAYSGKIAAAMALCGGGNNPDYASLDQMPLWVLHGTADRAIPWRDSQEVVDGVNSVGGSRLRFTKLPGLNHSILARCFYMRQTYDWLFSHSLADTGRPVNSDYEITVDDFSHAYDHLKKSDAVGLKIVSNKTTATYDEEGGKGGSSVRAKSSSSSASSNYHIIRKGDTLSAIARKHHTTVSKLCKLNGISKTTTLQIGRRLRVS